MPATCLVCGATKKFNKVKLFHFAVITQKLEHLHAISKRRRREWLRILRICEEDLAEAGSSAYICSRHFISGNPAKVRDINDPDWVPSQNLPLSNLAKQSKDEKIHLFPIQTNRPTSSPMKTDSKPKQSPIVRIMENETKKETKKIEELEGMLVQKNLIIHRLQEKLRHYEMVQSDLYKDDMKTQFYTGFATYKCFAAFASTVEGILPHSKFPSFTKMKMLIMVLTKLRLNLPITYLAVKYEIPFDDLCEIFMSSVKHLADHLHVGWPAKRKIPKFLEKIFGEKLAAIVDILVLEVDTDPPTFRSTKFLIAYSPCGRISFVSKPFAGVAKDSWVINHSGLLGQLKPSDLILSLRGGLHEGIAKSWSNKEVFMYTVESHGLQRLYLDDSNLCDLRINLQALLNHLTTIFGFLEHKEREMWMNYPIGFLATVVKLTAALRNLILPI